MGFSKQDAGVGRHFLLEGGLPDLEASQVALVVKNRLPMQEMQETWFSPWIGKIPKRRAWHPTPVLSPGKSHGQRRPVGHCPWGHEESDTTEHLARRDRTRVACIAGRLFTFRATREALSLTFPQMVSLLSSFCLFCFLSGNVLILTIFLVSTALRFIIWFSWLSRFFSLSS